MALTQKERQLVYQRKVKNNLYLFHDFQYEKIEKKKYIFFYRQINSEIGCLICYFCSKKKDYHLHGFDLFICNSKNSLESIQHFYDDGRTKHNGTMTEFWIPCFHAENESHLSCFVELNHEKLTDISKIDKKYSKNYQDWINKR